MLIEQTPRYKLYRCPVPTSELVRIADKWKGNRTRTFTGDTVPLHVDYGWDENLWHTVNESVGNVLFKNYNNNELAGNLNSGQQGHNFPLTIWRYHTKLKGIKAHCDPSAMGGRLIIAVEGISETRFYDWQVRASGYDRTMFFDYPGEQIDSITYHPGDMILINNSRWVHSTHPKDENRRCIGFEVEQNAVQFN